MLLAPPILMRTLSASIRNIDGANLEGMDRILGGVFVHAAMKKPPVTATALSKCIRNMKAAQDRCVGTPNKALFNEVIDLLLTNGLIEELSCEFTPATPHAHVCYKKRGPTVRSFRKRSWSDVEASPEASANRKRLKLGYEQFHVEANMFLCQICAAVSTEQQSSITGPPCRAQGNLCSHC
jgi:hypothetical protein